MHYDENLAMAVVHALEHRQRNIGYRRHVSTCAGKKEAVHISVQPKPGFGIGNRNQDQVSVSVSGP